MRLSSHCCVVLAGIVTVCGCTQSAEDAGTDGGGQRIGEVAGWDGGEIRLYSWVPFWWDVSDTGETIFASVHIADRFSINALKPGLTESVGSVTTKYTGAPTRGPADSFIVEGLNPNRWPSLYTVFAREIAPTEVSRCAIASVPSGFSVGASDGTGFWIAFDDDCQNACDRARVMVRITVDGGVGFGRAVCNGPRRLNQGHVVLHPFERRLVAFEAGTPIRFIRFAPDGRDVEVVTAPPWGARFLDFLTDSSALLAEDLFADGGSIIREYSLVDGGLVASDSDFRDAGRLKAIRGTRAEVLVLAQGKAIFTSREQEWFAVVRSAHGVQAYQALTPSGDEVKAVPTHNGGVRAYSATRFWSDAGDFGLRIRPVEFTPAELP